MDFIADPPDWLVHRFYATRGKEDKEAPDLSRHDVFITEDRNVTLTSIAGTLHNTGMSGETLYRSLSEINRERCRPPLDDYEIRNISNSIGKTEVHIVHGAYTDLWAARLFHEKYGSDLHWCSPLGGWLVWDNSRWLLDETLQIEKMAEAVIQKIHEQANATGDKLLKKFAIARESDKNIRAMLTRLKSLGEIPVSSNAFDQDTHKINSPHQTLDLKTGLTYQNHRSDLITRRIDVDHNPEAKCPRWLQFMDEIFCGDRDLIDYVQRAAGYSLSGDVSEHCMFVLHGMGRNGKSTFLKHISAIMGDYSATADAGLLIEKRDGGIPNDVARLRGVRLVIVQESKRGNSFDESRVKALTGGDRITARFMRKEFFEFNPTFKIWFSTNHKPDIVGTDLGIWRRIRTIPFERVFSESEVDKNLDEKLRCEYEGIFAWLVEGYKKWGATGLGENRAVSAAGEEYQEESDVMKSFIEEACEMTGSCLKFELLQAFQVWKKAAGGRWLSRNEINQYLSKKLGLKERRISTEDGRREWVGISIKKSVIRDTKIGHTDENQQDFGVWKPYIG